MPMARDGSGVYSKPAGTTATSGTTIESAKYNQTIDDLVTDANTARPIVAGGTGATTANAARNNLGVGTNDDVQFDTVKAVGTATGQTAHTGADDIVADHDGDSGVSILSGAASVGRIAFGDSGNAIAAKIQYGHSTGQMTLDAETDYVWQLGGVAKFELKAGGDLAVYGDIYRDANDGNFIISGGGSNATGAHIQLYGGGAAYANRMNISAGTHRITAQDDTEWARWESGHLQVAQTSTSTPGVGNTTQGSALNSSGGIYSHRSAAAGFHVGRDGDGNVIQAYINGTVEGRIDCTAASGMGWNNPSDVNLKVDIGPAPDTGELFDAVEVVSYNWKDKDLPRVRWGMIAQDTQPHIPEAVYEGTDTATDPWGIRSGQFIYPLIAEVKALRGRVAAAEARIAALEAG